MLQRGPEIRKVYRVQDPVAVRTWQLIDGRRILRQIKHRICQEFDVAEPQAEQDLRPFLTHLEQIGAIKVARRGGS